MISAGLLTYSILYVPHTFSCEVWFTAGLMANLSCCQGDQMSSSSLIEP